MEPKFRFNKYHARIIIGAGVVLLLVWFALSHLSEIGGGISWFLGLFTPLIIGGALAFIINIPMRFFENRLFPAYIDDDPKKAKRKKALKRPISLILAIILVIAIIAVSVVIIAPQLVDSIPTIYLKVSEFYETIKTWAGELQTAHPRLSEILTYLEGLWESYQDTVFQYIQELAVSVASSTWTIAADIVGGVTNMILGFVFSVYILAQKEALGRQFRKLLYAVIPTKGADQVVRVLDMSAKTFYGFVSGQLTEAVVIGMMFFVGSNLPFVDLPYATVTAVISGIMSLVPIIGTVVGCVINCLLILMVASPSKALVFLVMCIVIQQVESNLIYPRVVGNSVGLPSIWVLAAVCVGGAAWGILGIITFIPLGSVVYALVKEFAEKHLKQRDVPAEKIDRPESPPRLRQARARGKNAGDAAPRVADNALSENGDTQGEAPIDQASA